MAITNPTITPFDSTQTNTTIIPSSQQTNGYSDNEIPLAEHHGYLFNQWYLNFLHLKTNNVYIWDTSVPYNQFSLTMRNGRLKQSVINSNLGNDPIANNSDWLDVLGEDELTINFQSDADITLTGVQNLYKRIRLTDSGSVLTASRNINFSSTVKKDILIFNDTAQTITARPLGGSGVNVARNLYAILYSNGTNIIQKQTGGPTISGASYVDPDAIGANPSATLYPNGVIVGSTDNGTYVKFPDRTIILKSPALRTNGSTDDTFGNLRRSNELTFTFPVQTAETPVCLGGTVDQSRCFIGGGYSNSNSQVSYFVLSGESNAVLNRDTRMTVMGRF